MFLVNVAARCGSIDNAEKKQSLWITGVFGRWQPRSAKKACGFCYGSCNTILSCDECGMYVYTVVGLSHFSFKIPIDRKYRSVEIILYKTFMFQKSRLS